MKRVGLAERWKMNKLERRREVEIDIGLEGAMLMHWMFLVPDVQWKREDHFEAADKMAERQCAALAKFTDQKLLSEEQPPESENARQVLDLLKAAYEPKGSDEQKRKAWLASRTVIGREYLPGRYKLKAESIERIKLVLDHYRKKKSRHYLVNHIAALEAALDGKALPAAEDVEEAA